MFRYLRKGLLFSVPILAIVLFIVVVDPYEFVDIVHVINPQSKIDVLNRSDEVSPRGNILWKAVHYKNDPKSKLIIGDSQGRKIKESLINEICGDDYFNYCCEGASFETMIEIFWFATEQTKLETVFFQVGFMNYNASRSYSIFHFGKDMLDKPYQYFTTPDILVDSWMNLRYCISGDRSLVEHSYEYQAKEDLESLSEFRLGLFFGDYKYPDNSYIELKKISDYCKRNNIELNFLILPVYDRTKEYLVENDLAVMSMRFREDMHRLGKTYDFEVFDEFTGVRENFIDYFHPKQHILDDITREVWGEKK